MKPGSVIRSMKQNPSTSVVQKPTLTHVFLQRGKFKKIFWLITFDWKIQIFFQDPAKNLSMAIPWIKIFQESPVECAALEKCKGKKCSCHFLNTCEHGHLIFDLTNIR